MFIMLIISQDPVPVAGVIAPGLASVYPNQILANDISHEFKRSAPPEVLPLQQTLCNIISWITSQKSLKALKCCRATIDYALLRIVLIVKIFINNIMGVVFMPCI